MSKINKILIAISFVFLIYAHSNDGKISDYSNTKRIDDLYSSITSLVDIFFTEKLFIENTEIFLDYSIKILNGLKSKLRELKTNKTTLFEDELSLSEKLYFQNNLHEIAKSNYIGFSKNISYFRNKNKFPSDMDLEGVTRAVIRLKDVYNFTAKEFANGSFLKMENIKSTKRPKLTSSDCFEIGYKLYSMDKLNEAEEWFNTAFQLYNKNDENNVLKKHYNVSEILDFMAYLRGRHGDIEDIEESIKLIKLAIKLDPTYEHLYKQLKSFERIQNLFRDGEINVNFNKIMDNYKRGCRGQFQKSSQVRKKLYCTYKFGKHPFLKLAPIKVEISHVKPYVAIFHDVLYENEIELMKYLSLSNNLLSRALVWNATEAKSKFSHVRTSKFGWLDDDDHPFFKTLTQRIADMTEMSMETAESLQIMNYGIGGHYDVHADFLDEPTKNNNVKPYSYYDWGNRIATILFYMADVEQGGATVFPRINTAVLPRKGTAVFWFNMLPRGDYDEKSRHGACPVVFGSKWVINKWIRYNGQIFERQCKINKNDYYHIFSEL